MCEPTHLDITGSITSTGFCQLGLSWKHLNLDLTVPSGPVPQLSDLPSQPETTTTTKKKAKRGRSLVLKDYQEHFSDCLTVLFNDNTSCTLISFGVCQYMSSKADSPVGLHHLNWDPIYRFNRGQDCTLSL